MIKTRKLLLSITAFTLVLGLGGCSLEEESDSGCICDDNESSSLGSLCDEHTFGEYVVSETDERKHERVCSVCGYKEETFHQAYDQEGNCEFCPAEGLNTSGLSYELNTQDYVSCYVSDYDFDTHQRDLYIPAYAYVEEYELTLPVTGVGNPDASSSGDAVINHPNSGSTYLEFVSLPSTCKSIYPYAFYQCYNLSEIYIPEGVTTIGSEAFHGCTYFRTIDLPSTITSIGSGAFSYCYGLTEINIPNGVTTIENETFTYCYTLFSVVAKGVSSIGEGAFKYCYALKDLQVGKVVELGKEAFDYCAALESGAFLSEGLKELPEYAFGYCYSLGGIIIPTGLTIISTNVFRSCQSLRYVVIPSSLESIGNYGFGFCYSLTEVFYEGDIDSWDDITIGSSNDYIKDAPRYYLDEDGSLSKEDPEGNYWHYEYGVPTIW